MLNKIIQDLKQNTIQIYNSDFISVGKVLHHSFNYPKATKLFKKYKADTDLLKSKLYDYLNHNEINQNTYFNENQNQVQRFFKEGIEVTFGKSPRFSRQEQNSNPVAIKALHQFNTVMSIANQIETQKALRKMQQLMGGMSGMHELSFSSFLRAVIESGKQSHMLTNTASCIEFLNMLQDVGFDIDRFIQDDDNDATNKPSLLEELCVDLNELATKGKISPVIGRDKEINTMINILRKKRKNNPILTGKAGTGKTAIAEGLALKIVNGEVPDYLKNARIFSLTVVDIMKGTKFRGEFEEKISNLLKDFKRMEDEGEILPILFIDEIHSIMGVGGGESLDIGNVLKPALARGELRTIGATTTDEWHEFIKNNGALDRRFASIPIKEPSQDETIQIINQSIHLYEEFYDLKYNKDTINEAVKLTGEFIVDNNYPDKAFDLIDHVGSMVSLQNRKEITKNDIHLALSDLKNIDFEAIAKISSKKKFDIENTLKKYIVGQDHVIATVSKSLKRYRAGLNANNKPIGSFLFVGPTGTGKTELAKKIADEFKAHFERIDMSEYKEAHSISKLIGSPPGYVGSNKGSYLTKTILENPKTVLLLDEVEKAHPEIFDLFLQAMDNAKITDSQGKEVSFKNVLIIMTSNVGTQKLDKKAIGFTSKSNTEIKNEVMQAVHNNFRKEFLARLTGNKAIVFNKLDLSLLKEIILKEIDVINKERFKDKNTKISLTTNAINYITKKADEINLGARPVKDILDQEVIDLVVDKILEENFNNEIIVDYVDNQFVLN